VLATVAMDVVGTIAIFLLERHATGSDITTVGSAAFWTTSQLLTVSSSYANPLSSGGQILDVVLEAWGITVVTMLAGVFGAFFYRRGLERDPLEPEGG
jgi:hypothetical protein